MREEQRNGVCRRTGLSLRENQGPFIRGGRDEARSRGETLHFSSRPEIADTHEKKRKSLGPFLFYSPKGVSSFWAVHGRSRPVGLVARLTHSPLRKKGRFESIPNGPRCAPNRDSCAVRAGVCSLPSLLLFRRMSHVRCIEFYGDVSEL